MKTLLLALLTVPWLSSQALAEDLLKPTHPASGVEDVLPDNALETDTTYQARGVIRAIDRLQGSVTIAHEAIPALKWPAAVVPFRADAALLDGLAVGDEVAFRFTDGEMDPHIVSIRRQ